MRTLPKPRENAADVFELCISKVRRKELKQRLAAIGPNIVEAANRYDRAASAAELHGFPRSENVGAVTNKEMIAVYVGRMAQKSQPGRPVYDKLLIAPLLQFCPLCASGRVTTLDHHLPKTEYPVLAVTPTNLVPACEWCQGRKRRAYPTIAEEQTIHPYYDDFTDQTWLKATVTQTAPASFFFFADPPAEWDAVRQERVRNHLTTFRLPELYASNAGNELLNIRQHLSVLFDAGGAAIVQSHLTQQANSRVAAFRNSWETAMYCAAAASDWFCNRGFAFEYAWEL